MVRVGIIGATGYGGREMVRLLAGHPEAELVAAVSESSPGERLEALLPALRGAVSIELEPFDAASLADRCDVVALAVPGGKSTPYVAQLRKAGARVLDMGPDFRLKDPEAFRAYYKLDHGAPELLDEAVYGFAPLHRAAVRAAQLVAVPGCYPMSVIVPLQPVVAAGLADPAVPVVVNAVSGVSGAGRGLIEALHFPEMNENVRAYKLAVHQHTPEIEQVLGGSQQVQFTPHVASHTRGILSTIVVRLAGAFDASVFDAYAGEPFIRIMPAGQVPDVKQVRGSNCVDLGWVMDDRTGNLLLVGAVDNLVGGTAGVALQNLNIMFGLDETLGLPVIGVSP